jgi:hypothetical protein
MSVLDWTFVIFEVTGKKLFALVELVTNPASFLKGNTQSKVNKKAVESFNVKHNFRKKVYLKKSPKLWVSFRGGNMSQ